MMSILNCDNIKRCDETDCVDIDDDVMMTDQWKTPDDDLVVEITNDCWLQIDDIGIDDYPVTVGDDDDDDMTLLFIEGYWWRLLMMM